MLAICRGMQALNVARGGTLHQHLPDRTDLEHRQAHEPFEPAHAVTVTAGSLAAPDVRTAPARRSTASTTRPSTASAPASRSARRAADGTVEAVCDPTARFCLGVQWHPELLTHRPEQALLFEALLVAAGAPALALAA